MRLITRIAAIWGFAAAALTLATPAQATLTLTAAGTSNGFSLTTFADFSNVTGGGCCGGPFGIAVAGNGNVLVSVGATGQRYVMNNADGQTTATAISSTFSNSGVVAYARAGGLAYGAQNGQFVQFNNDGTVNHVLTGAPGTFLGMWGAPNGHIIATSSQGLIDIDPLAAGGAGTYRIINAGANGDGVTVSPDGVTAYVEQGGGIQAVNIATGAYGLFIAVPGNSADGTGVISGGAFDGDIIINNNNGDVDLYHFATSTMIQIATGSSPFGTDRGDYVAIDTKGCLFLDEGNRVDRLCLSGASIGDPNGTVPEPTTALLAGAALLGLAAARRRRS